MPATRPRASFEPIPPDFDVRTFIESAENFQYVDRISYEMIADNGMEQFEKLVLLHVIIGGKPLVIDGFEEVLDPWTFTPSWLRDNHGDKVENARNLSAKENIPLTIKHYLKHMPKLTEQFFEASDRYREKNRQRIYLKDIDCPKVWHDKIREHIPPGLFYLNESTGDYAGPGAVDGCDGRKGRGIGRAGDLMSSLPPEMRAENLMCYIGHEGTYTPSHREMCASLGQNIMVNASGNIGEDGKPERPGSSLWFMTESKDRHLVSEYWLSVLGHDIEVENHFAQLIAWKKAPFKTYVVEQRPGDFILIPPLAPHQVWNRGTRTMKIAWNRTTAETLELALNEALPNSRVVCRDEQYKNKSIVYYTLLKYSNLIKTARAQVEAGGEQAEAIQLSVKVRQVQRDFKRLFGLYKSILLSEMFAPESREHPEFLQYDSNVTCSYCRCNIFNRFLSCKTCKNLFSSEIEDPYDICMDCYCMGRSCGCQSGYTWVEQWKWKDLIHKYEEWRAQVVDIDGQVTEKTPLPLQEERRYLGKKTLAQICQEQLRIRPFVDVKNPAPKEASEDEEPVVDEYGNVKKASNRKSKQWLNKHKSCHFCLHCHPKWKMAFCSDCDLAYCYGVLFRAHDLMPVSVMEDYHWKCPHCKRVCNTGACRRDPRQNPYEPKGTLLGHDTKKVADPRSVECLVDFSVSNLNWLREEEGMAQNAMQRRMDQAEREKEIDPSLDARFIDEDDAFTRYGITYSPADIDGAYGGSSIIHQGGNNSENIDDMDDEIPRLSQKHHLNDDDHDRGSQRKKKKRQSSSKDNGVQSQQPKNTPGKEYEKERQRKLFDEAKRDDRSIIVAARMKGKSKIVKLSLSISLLYEIQNRPVCDRQATIEQQTVEENDNAHHVDSILQSDILSKPTVNKSSKGKEKDGRTFRVRVEEDGAYSTRKKRNSDVGGSTRVGRPRGPRRYEELTLDSDEEPGEQDSHDDLENPRRTRGRASQWLARRNEGEKDLPTELPPNFRDGNVRPGRERVRERHRIHNERRETTLSQLNASPQPTEGPSIASTRDRINSVPDIDGTHEEDDQNSNVLILAQRASAAMHKALSKEAEERATVATAATAAAAAAKEAEENLRAKMALFPESDTDNELVDGFLNDLPHDTVEDEDYSLRPTPGPATTRTPLATNSLLARPEMAGKQIKVVSASNKQNSSAIRAAGTTAITTPITLGFTSINKPAAPVVPAKAGKPKAVDLSDSGSDEDVPAFAPAPKRPVGRPPGHPKVVPTRGRGWGKRGRGRPRKTA